MSSASNPAKIPLSDSWLTEVQSDESDSREPRPFEFVKKPKLSQGSHAICGEEDDSSSGSSVDDSDDADDEDWIASDHERKRRNRGNTSTRYTKYLYQAVASRVVDYHRDHLKIKASSHSPRVSYQYSTSAVTSGSVRPSLNSPKTSLASVGGSRDAHVSESLLNRRHGSSATISVDKSLLEELMRPRQCFGPGCTRAAAGPDTKYCSEKCGLQLAIRRLETLLPENLPALTQNEHRADNTAVDLGTLDQNLCMDVAERLDRSRLEEIQVQKCAVHDRLVQLELEHQQLSSLINQARQYKPKDSFKDASKITDQVEQLEPVVCVTCASEVSMRHALRHMEKCFQKMEGNTVFCANQKEQIMGTPLFCDTYDVQAKAYCKRLRVVCEHFKEPKLPPDSICGFPLVRDVFIETGEYCCVPRSKCTSHLGWERLRRARIDIERYRCFIKMDDLLQEEQRLHQSMSQRGGMLGLLLHRTIDHNPSVPVLVPSELCDHSRRPTTM